MAEDVFGIVGTVQAGAFRVEQVVGEGGFAVVYRAHHEAFRAKVALKCLKVPGTLSADHQTEFLERFREEAELLFRLSASISTVVRPLHVGTLDTKAGVFAPFIALEWLEGQTLDKIISKRRDNGLRPMTLKKAVRLLAPVAHALERAHRFPAPDGDGEVAILHRDLKPENIFVADVHGGEVVKILDFGLGKMKKAASQVAGKLSLDASMLSAFTPAYGAPEQWLPKRFGQTGTWTDVWGLALSVVEACCGHTPIDGDQAAILGAAIDPQRRPTPRAEGVEVSDAVEDVFRKALAVEPEARYSDVGLFWRELNEALGIATTEVIPAGRRDPRMDGGERPRTEYVARAGGTAPLPAVPTDPLGGTVPLAEVDRHAPTELIPASGPLPAAPVVPDLVLDGIKPQRVSAAPKSQRVKITVADEPSTSARAVPSSRRMPLELDGVGITPVSTRAARTVREVGNYGAPARAASVASVKARLRGPVKLVLIGCALMAVDYGYAAATGENLALGPVRPFWFAAPFVLIGLGMAFARLFASDS